MKIVYILREGDVGNKVNLSVSGEVVWIAVGGDLKSVKRG